ncbi:hypothetical protein [Serratia liquefaciens]|uniref:hypothetical protein n=1 Tax=Serratia liquefaciens TaxID=614 RepID=UPI00165D12BA|nr:hypothetical protein [Serratia liquefaciens]QNQ55435.1 hypothetical protein IAI46_05460 [Serratia liquefaciens]
MRTKKIRAVLITALLAISFIIYEQVDSLDKKAVSCQADILDTDTVSGKVSLSYDIRMNYIMLKKGKENIVNLTGYITSNNNRYRILRNMYFTLNLTSDYNNIYSVKYTHEHVQPSDNVPDEVAQRLKNTLFEGANSHVRITKIRDYIYLIQGMSQPTALCYFY